MSLLRWGVLHTPQWEGLGLWVAQRRDREPCQGSMALTLHKVTKCQSRLKAGTCPPANPSHPRSRGP